MDAFNDTLRSWQNFYFMTGGASAGLLGLMFLVISLGMHLVTDETKEQIDVFITPSIFYFVSALVLSCVMLVPAFTPLSMAIVLLLAGTVGLIRTVPVAARLRRIAIKHQDFELWEHLSQIILPVVSYALVLIAGVGILISQLQIAFIGLWLTNMMLLVSAIANTWSMVLWIVEQRV